MDLLCWYRVPLYPVSHKLPALERYALSRKNLEMKYLNRLLGGVTGPEPLTNYLDVSVRTYTVSFFSQTPLIPDLLCLGAICASEIYSLLVCLYMLYLYSLH